MKTLKRLGKLLWIATTPIALAILLATPQRRARADAIPERDEHEQKVEKEEHAGKTEEAHGEGEGEHHFDPHPLKNFADFGYGKKDAEGEKLDPGDEPMPAPFSMALLNFAVLVFLVGKYGAPSFAKQVRTRHEEIAKALDEGRRLRQEAQEKLELYKEKLKNLDAEVKELMDGIREEAEVEKKRILADAEARATRMQRDAEMQIRGEIQRVTAVLEREAVLAAVAMAEKLLRDKTTDADQKAMAADFLKAIEKGTTSTQKVAVGGMHT